MAAFYRISRGALMKRLLPLLLLLGVSCDKIDYIEIEPDSLVFKQLSNEQWLVAHGKSRQGRPGLRVVVAWSSADPSIATVDEKGKARPKKSGHTEIVATYRGVEARIPVDVLLTEKIDVEPKEVTVKVGEEPVELHVKSFDYLGKEQKDRTTTYHSNDEHIVTMGQNAVYGMNAGETLVTVSVDGVKYDVKVKVEDDKKGAKK
jgi:hypothetical protein